MDYLIDKYLKEPDYVKKLFDSSLQISLKVDGEAFQIGYDKTEDKVTYHKRGGSAKKLGPIIDEYTQLFRKKVNDAISKFEDKKDIVKQNKFYAIEMFNNEYILLTVIDHNDNIISDSKDLQKIAKELDILTVPVLFNGKLNNEQKDQLIALMTLDETIDNETFKTQLKNIFGSGEYTKFLKGDEVEGIVLTCNIDNGVEQLKIINPAFKTRHGKDLEEQKKRAENERDSINNLIYKLYDILNEAGEYLNGKWFLNLDKNLVNIFNNEQYAKSLKDLANKIPYVKKDFWDLQMDKASDDIKQLIKQHGDIIKVIYEVYMKVFYKIRKRNYIISKDFNMKVNDLIIRLQKQTNESYKSLNQFINEKLNNINNMKSLSEYIKSVDEGRYEPTLRCSQSNSVINDYIEYGMDYNEMKYLFNHLDKYSEYIIYPCSWKGRNVVVHTDMPFVVKQDGRKSIIVNQDDYREFYDLESYINNTDFDGLVVMEK